MLRGIRNDWSITYCARNIMSELRRTNGNMLYHAKRGFHRSIFSIVVLKAVQLQLERSTSVHHYVRCVQLLFESTPEPFISVEEFREFLHFLFYMNDYGLDMDPEVECMVEIYRHLFRNYHTLLYSPRSLKHLCRCEARKSNIYKSSTLPYLIKNMNIPKTLKDFLLGAPEFVD